MSLTIRYLVGPYGPWRQCFYCGEDLRGYDRARLICDDCEAIRRPALRRAIDAVRSAVSNGRLKRPETHKCVDCGSKAVCYDHRDYTKQLVVDPVCRRCNQLRGPAAIPI